MKRLLASLLLAALAIGASADSLVIECPQTISVMEVAAKAPPRAWKPLRSVALREFSYLEVFDGHPYEKASLIPDQLPSPAATSATWRFPLGTKNVWLSCSYRATGATLAWRLPDGVRRCTAAYRLVAEGYDATGALVCD